MQAWGGGVARGQAQVLADCNALEDATELWELMAWNQAENQHLLWQEVREQEQP